jgi:hypothetical protein
MEPISRGFISPPGPAQADISAQVATLKPHIAELANKVATAAEAEVGDLQQTAHIKTPELRETIGANSKTALMLELVWWVCC